MHGRATRTRAWCGHVHAHGKDMHVRVATNRAGILLAIMRPGQLKRLLCFHFLLSPFPSVPDVLSSYGHRAFDALKTPEDSFVGFVLV